MEKPRLVVFDIDGTLLPGTSCERLFTRYLVSNRIVNLSNLFSFIGRGVALIPRGKSYIISANKGYLRGFSIEYMDKIGKEFFQNQVENKISKKGLTSLTAHKMKDHRVILLSGMPEFLLKNFSRLLKVSEYYGSIMETDNGSFTGKTLGTFPLGKGKVEILESIMKKHDLTWDDVTAYADHYLDRFLLQKVGNPVAANPDKELKSMAEQNSWRIEYFDDTMRSSSIT
jgi:HAD superfamily hydrolase (TIGR01490 family)